MTVKVSSRTARSWSETSFSGGCIGADLELSARGPARKYATPCGESARAWCRVFTLAERALPELFVDDRLAKFMSVERLRGIGGDGIGDTAGKRRGVMNAEASEQRY